MNKFNLVIGIVAIIAIVLSVVAISSLKGVQFGSTHFTGPIYSEEGYYVDTTERIDGDGAASFTTIAGSGAVTLSNTLGVSGTLTASGDVEVADDFAVATTTNDYDCVIVSATSTFVGPSTHTTTTLFIVSQGSEQGGQIILEDSDGAGCSLISIIDGTIKSKTVTCPAQ